MTMRDNIAATRKNNAGPVAKKSALISRQRTLEPRKPPNVAAVVVGTFSETLASKLVKDHTGKPAANLESSVCFRRRRCPNCLKLDVGLDQIARHQCYYVDCPSCHEYVDSETHLCFIQRPTQDKKKKKKRKRKHQGGPRAKRGAATTEPDTTPEEEEEEDLPPLHVFFDIEAMQPNQQHIANLLVAETEGDDEPKPFPGPSCTRDFLEWLDTLTLNDTRQVNVLAHNFQGYDGYFVVQQYHSDNRIVQQLRNGCKLLEVKHDRIRFIDSMSFFQMPLSAFPKTFGLTELCKAISPTSSTCPMIIIKTTWVSSHHAITTCPKPCHPKTGKPSKPGIKNNATRVWCFILNKS